jgi:hypothetical protein
MNCRLIEETARRLNKKANVSLAPRSRNRNRNAFGFADRAFDLEIRDDAGRGAAAFHIQRNRNFLNLAACICTSARKIRSRAVFGGAFRKRFLKISKKFISKPAQSYRTQSRRRLSGQLPARQFARRRFSAGKTRDVRRRFRTGGRDRNAWQTVKEAAARAERRKSSGKSDAAFRTGQKRHRRRGRLSDDRQNIKERPQTAPPDSDESRVLLGETSINFGVYDINDDKSNVSSASVGAIGGGYHIKTELAHPNLKSEVWLLTDAGFNILLSMETYKWYYHLISAERAGEAHNFPYKLAGPLCDGGDVYFDIEGERRLPDYRLLPEEVKPNEVLALLNCGAYSVAQMFQYNGRFLPAIVLIKVNGDIELIRKRDKFEDLITNDVF